MPVRRPSHATVVAYLALFVALGGGAYAVTFVSSSGNVKVCVKKSNGAMRAVAAGTKCRKSEQTLTLNQRGPIGPTGPAGVAGSPGAPGTPGAPGANAAIASTRLHRHESFQLNTPLSSTWKKGLVIGSFTKQEASSRVRVSYQSWGTGIGGGCEFQLRIDGVDDRGNADTGLHDETGGMVVVPNNASVFARGVPYTNTADFFSVSAGSHDVELWYREGAEGDPTSCYDGGGTISNFGRDALVDELR
jgi:hypothetical protein